MEPKSDGAFDKAIWMIAMAARDPSIAQQLRGPAEEREQLFKRFGLDKNEAKEAARQFSEEYFEGRTEANFW